MRKMETVDQAPQLSPEVWELIFKKLDFQRQKTCRLVCQSWNEEICRIFKSEQRVISYVNVNLKYEDWMEMLNRRETLLFSALPDPFLELGLNVSGHCLLEAPSAEIMLSHPLTRLKLQVGDQWPSFSRELLKPECTKSLRDLQLTLDHDVPLFYDVSFPVLESLSVRMMYTLSQVDYTSVADWVLHIFCTSPKLTSLDVHVSCLEQMMAKEKEFRSLTDLRINTEERYLMWLTDKDLNKNSFCSLRRLSMDGNAKYTGFKGIFDLLSAVSETLEYFSAPEVTFGRYINNFPFSPKLTYLKAKGLRIRSTLLEKLPALKSLKGIISLVIPKNFIGKVFPSVETIGVAHKVATELSAKDYALLVEVFPNAKVWDLPDTAISEFCEFTCSSTVPLAVLRIRIRLMNFWEVIPLVQRFAGLKELELKLPEHMMLSQSKLKAVASISGLKSFRIFASGLHDDEVEEETFLNNFEVIFTAVPFSKNFIEKFSRLAPNAVFRASNAFPHNIRHLF